MKKLIAILALTAAVATPAFASDGSETTMDSNMQSWTQPGYAATSDGMDSYAFAPRANWQNGNMSNWQSDNAGQWQTQSPLFDR